MSEPKLEKMKHPPHPHSLTRDGDVLYKHGRIIHIFRDAGANVWLRINTVRCTAIKTRDDDSIRLQRGVQSLTSTHPEAKP
jgi:hypothetical protein